MAQFRQRLNVRPEGFDLVEALQIELMNDDIAVPTPSVHTKHKSINNFYFVCSTSITSSNQSVFDIYLTFELDYCSDANFLMIIIGFVLKIIYINPIEFAIYQ